MSSDCDSDIPAQETQAADLSLFQQNILVTLAAEPQHGLGVKSELERYYGKGVNHGRLYPNLDQLVELGYVDKGTLDKRTNLYSLTDQGQEIILEQLAWELDRLQDHAAIEQRLTALQSSHGD